MPRPPATPTAWTFLTNHAHVLVCIHRDERARVREIAAAVGVTERAVLRILGELEAAGYVRVTREGRRNRYAVRGGAPLRHPLEAHRTVDDLLALVAGRRDPEATADASR